VKDTVEVDLNVSRHLEFEFAAKDWDALVHFYSCLGACSLVFSLVTDNATLSLNSKPVV
jgi:hypothetical protein